MTKPPPSTIHKLESSLLWLTLFLIPSNLAIHFDLPSAYINGRLSDYLLPKLYLSDISLVSLLIINMFNKQIKHGKSIKLNKFTYLFIAYLLVRSLLSTNPLSSSWYVFKLIELLLFGIYLVKNHTPQSLSPLLFKGLGLSFLLQSTLSIYQYINQKSLFGYYFLGEPNLEAIGISKTTLHTALEVMPYGTTPHPNVLAGFTIVSFIFLTQSIQINLNQNLKKAAKVSITGLSLAIIYLTQSLSTLSGIIFVNFIKIIKNIASNKASSLLIQIICYVTLLASLLIYPIFHHYQILADNPSFSQRYEINRVANQIIIKSPLPGVGPNLFTQHYPNSPLPGQQSYLLQPPHHLVYLLLSEVGLVGCLLVTINIYLWYQRAKRSGAPNSAYLPLASLFIILLFDHYPLTLQTGQLLLALSLSYPLLIHRS